jgi:hypothetical protein
MAAAAKRLMIARLVEVRVGLACVGDGYDVVNEVGKVCSVVPFAIRA